MRCLTPASVKRAGRYIAVPCGKCPICKSKRRLEWSIRILHEAERSKQSYFVTLTYNNEYVPYITSSIGGIEFVLCKRDLQLFFKRLRKTQCFRYYAIGEYGSNSRRPHYHIVFFLNESISFDDFFKDVWNCWKKGFVTVDTINIRRAFYITKYHINPLSGSDSIPDEYKEFSLMSRRPGIGNGFIEEVVDSYRRSPRNYLWNKHYKVALPRYYKDKIFDKKTLYDFGSYRLRDLYDYIRENYNEEEVPAMYLKAIRDAFDLFQYKSIINSKHI